MPDRLTVQQLDDIDTRAGAATPGPWELYEGYGPHFYAYLRGSHMQGIGTLNFGDGDAADADREFVAHAREDVDALLAEVRRLRARTLTESEYSAAWHAVEGAAGEEGADPGTILHAVLGRLGIVLPGVGEQLAVEASEACGKCKQPFDPADTSFDGRARYASTSFCRGCVDRCHDNEIADHRCVICA